MTPTPAGKPMGFGGKGGGLFSIEEDEDENRTSFVPGKQPQSQSSMFNQPPKAAMSKFLDEDDEEDDFMPKIKSKPNMPSLPGLSGNALPPPPLPQLGGGAGNKGQSLPPPPLPKATPVAAPPKKQATLWNEEEEDDDDDGGFLKKKTTPMPALPA